MAKTKRYMRLAVISAYVSDLLQDIQFEDKEETLLKFEDAMNKLSYEEMGIVVEVLEKMIYKA